MRYRAFALLLLLVLNLPAFAQDREYHDFLAAGSMLAHGRPPTSFELAHASKGRESLAALVEGHRSRLGLDSVGQRAVIDRAWRDAYGLAPDEGALAELPPGGATYADLLRKHLTSLAAHPDDFRQVIERAYQQVIRRPAYPEEHDYWKLRGTLPYVVLVGAIENWAQRNQPGLMVTTGTPSISVNSRFLTTLRLSLPIANEARTLLGLPVWTDVGRQHSPGNHVVAVGAADIASVGGVHFLLAGGGPLAGR